ncbi:MULTISPECIES: pilus assembly protein [Myxococcus]|uniref:Pilus assembly protein n=1 Tax=Myxococcus xanthus TaxID=34 RepID=A0AAE6FVV8_MYXXA|nr:MULTISPECIES: pilus assembly protein [Myxococcus]QDE66183.1 pilus assembly protein [Myxococcus xanthus]QDE73456.1 pilus assembly protein [Myxococcus xanthus]QDE80725.1 pilus assembly protein [Myxococcus xanthus]QDE95040.1 pilus assembly protein [Myxococcus xanthus]QDF02313.1 pilus assembly protein [Myxococcus xanthus]
MQSPRLVRHSRRGQALVLFALTLLLLTLMVLMTLGFGMRAKERVEIQMAADAAAYSQAVATARAFNAIAVMNRAQVAHMVAMAGTQSLISHSSQEYAAHDVACPGSIPPPVWFAADAAAAMQVQQLQGRAGNMFQAGLNIYGKLLSEHIAEQELTRRVAQAVSSELRAPPEGAAKSFSELNGGNDVPERDAVIQSIKAGTYGCGVGDGALCPSGGGTPALNATMGSMGWTWVHNRPGGTAGFGTGGAAISTSFRRYGSVSQMDPASYHTVSGRNSTAHDHGRVVIPTRCTRAPTLPPIATDAWVMSDEEQTHEDQHVYGARMPPGQAPEDGKPPYETHTLGACVVCPGIWPYSVGYNVDELHAGASNHYGQPKLYSMLYRDYASAERQARPDPWNLFFRFRFAGTETEFDNSSPLGRIRPTGREDVHRNQVALSAGMVYYHRPRPAAQGGGWREPPNFLNPFWRATLVSAEGARDDRPADSLSAAGFAGHARALRELHSVGYRGGGPGDRGY